MNPELEQISQKLEQVITRLDKLEKSDRYVYEKDLEVATGRNILMGSNTLIKPNHTAGFTVGSAATDKLGFYGVTPVDQPATVSDASGCAGTADNKVNDLIDRLQELGLIA